MRVFWAIIAVLAVTTLGLNLARTTAKTASGDPSRALVSAGVTPPPSAARTPARDAAPSPPVVVDQPVDVVEAPNDEPADTPTGVSAELPVEAVAGDSADTTQDQVDPTDPSNAVAIADPEIADEASVESETKPSGLSLDALLGVIAEASKTEEPAQPDFVFTEPEASGPVADASPGFEVRSDGSLMIPEVGVIAGDGSARNPFVLDWTVMRSVAREYDPKQGDDTLPEWVNELDGKHVRVEGNTLLPVVAQSTNELLVMQNPWDGCCIGIPPTPYDAIEVKLTVAAQFGSSVTGFGMVEGVMDVDPYIVSGWLLGLYVINDASFESAAGITLPDF